MEVMDMNGVIDCLEAEFVSCAVNVTAFNAATGQPHREPPVIMVPTIDLAGIGTGFGHFDNRRTPKFSASHQ